MAERDRQQERMLEFGNHQLEAPRARCCGEYFEALKSNSGGSRKARGTRVLTSSNRRYLFRPDITRGLHNHTN